MKKLPVGNNPIVPPKGQLPKGSRPLPPVKNNVLIFPGNFAPVVEEVDTKVIFVDFHTKQKIGHVS